LWTGVLEEKIMKLDELENTLLDQMINKRMNMKRQKKMEIAFESFWKNNNKLNNILNGVNNGIMDKISIGEFAQLCFKEGFNAGCWACDDRWIDCEKSNN
jgi:hypothetical protein